LLAIRIKLGIRDADFLLFLRIVHGYNKCSVLLVFVSGDEKIRIFVNAAINTIRNFGGPLQPPLPNTHRQTQDVDSGHPPKHGFRRLLFPARQVPAQPRRAAAVD
jgi:hypothetical protein